MKSIGVTGIEFTLSDFPDLGDNVIEVEIESEPGFGGAPVMNGDGRVIGLIYAATSGGNARDLAFLVPASRLVEILDEVPPFTAS